MRNLCVTQSDIVDAGVEYWQSPDPASSVTTKQCSGDEDPTCSASIPSTGINTAHLVVGYSGHFYSIPINVFPSVL
jgi:hypothetical protein